MSLKLENTEKYLKIYVEGLKKLLIDETNRKDRLRSYNSGNINSPISASGSLAESYKLESSKKTEIIKYNILGNSYAEKVDEGTTSTSVSKGKLIQWIQNKNGFKDLNGNTINLSDTKKIDKIASLISKSLKLNGIKATNFLSDIVKLKFKELSNIGNTISKDVELDFDNILLKAGYNKTGKETYTIETKIKE